VTHKPVLPARFPYLTKKQEGSEASQRRRTLLLGEA
jgi:hypothetical protein